MSIEAEAERRYPLNGSGGMVDSMQTHRRLAFVAGAEWQAAQLRAAHKATTAQHEEGGA